jgi:hypothetical protein
MEFQFLINHFNTSVVLILMGRGLILQRSISLTLIGLTIFEKFSISIQCLLLYRYTYQLCFKHLIRERRVLEMREKVRMRERTGM